MYMFQTSNIYVTFTINIYFKHQIELYREKKTCVGKFKLENIIKIQNFRETIKHNDIKITN